MTNSEIPQPPPPPRPVISRKTRLGEPMRPNIRYVLATATCARCEFRLALDDEKTVLAQVREHVRQNQHAITLRTVFTMFVYDRNNVLPEVLNVNSDGEVIFKDEEESTDAQHD